MSKIGKLLEEIKTNSSREKKIEKTLKKLTENANIEKGGQAVQTTQKIPVKTSNTLASAIIHIPIYILILYLIVMYFSTLGEWVFFGVNFLPIPTGSVSIMSWLVSFMIVGTAILFMFGFSEKKEQFAIKELEIIVVVFFLLMLFTFFFANTTEAQERRDITLAQSERNVGNFFTEMGCLFTGSKTCVEEKLNADSATKSDVLNYNVKFIEPVSSVKRDVAYYTEKDIKVQFEIESTKDLIVEKLDCYYNSKKKENLFDTITINEEIKTQNSGIHTWYCRNFTSIKLEDQTLQEITIYPVLTLKLNSVINHEVPIINYGLFTQRRGVTNEDNEYYDLINYFAGDYESFKDSTAKLDVSSTFKTQLPIVIGDGETTDRSFAIYIKKGINNFGKFKSGEVKDITIPVSLKLDGNKESYLEKIEFDNEVYEIDFRLEDNEELKFDNEKIVQNIEVVFETIFEKSGTQTIKVTRTEEEIAKIKEEEKVIVEAEQKQTQTNEIINKLGQPDENGIYTYNVDLFGSSDLYYKISYEVWYWSPDKTNWMTLDQETTIGGTYDGQSPSTNNLKFIRSLKATQ